MSEKCFKYRIYPNAAQRELIAKTFGCVRFVFNSALAARIAAYSEREETLRKFDQMKQLPALKAEYPWLCEVDSTALQSAVENLDNAYQHFFRRAKTGKGKPGFPRFKTKRRRQSFKSKMNLAVDDSAIKLPKLGHVKAAISRPVEGRIISITVSLSASGKYYAAVCCTDVVHIHLPKNNKAIALDLGLHTLAVCSDGQRIKNPKHLSKAEKKLARAQRRLSHKKGAKKGERASANYKKQQKRVARIHEKVANQRTDFLHKTTTCLIHENQVIGTESLQVKNMVKNHHLAKAIIDASWAELVRQLEYKSRWYGRAFVKVDTFFASSQTCCVCKTKEPKVKDLSVRAWICCVCGTYHDRDLNAAKNILSETLLMVGWEAPEPAPSANACGELIRPPSAPARPAA